MNRCARIAACLLLTCAAARGGDVVDAIVAVVNRVPLLQSQWEEAVRFEALEEGRAPSAADAQQRRAALDRLIDQALIQQQMRAAHYPELDDADAAKAVAEWRSQVAPGLSDEDWNRRVADFGLTPNDVAAHVRAQQEQMRFLDARFRSAAKVDDADVERYYRDELLPQLRAAGAPDAPLVEVRSRIQQLLVEQRINSLLNSWLQNLRSQARVVIREAPVRSAVPAQTSAGGGQ